MKESAVREDLAKLVEALLEDEDLRIWFESFEGVPPAQRRLEFANMAGQMKAAGEHPELIAATELLAQPEIFRAMQATVRELRSAE